MSARFQAMDIANFYIQMVNSMPDSTIDNLKLNKLLYYAQGHSIIRLGHPIFGDDIQAWDYGPVVPKVYHAFKCCGSRPIENATDTFDESRLNTDELELLIDVYSDYGRYTGSALKDMTHQKGGPWDLVYRRGENRVIDTEKMRQYFQQIKLEEFRLNPDEAVILTSVPDDWDSAEDAVYG